jgi:hypothetical protein
MLTMVSCARVVWNIALMEPVMAAFGGGGAGWLVVGSGLSVHNPSRAVDRVSAKTTISWRLVATLIFVNSALQPWAQSWAMGMRELEAMFRKTCARRADFGRPGIRMFPVCVLVMMAPSGRETWMLLQVDVGVTSSRSWDTLKKCPVAPVSIIDDGEGAYNVELM